jgi:hypothetical protein
MPYHYYRRANSNAEALGPLSRTVTTHILLKATILTKYVALRVKRPIIVRMPIESRQRVSY